jgi:glycosyltransferase involved in cell wall biosynthesis
LKISVVAGSAKYHLIGTIRELYNKGLLGTAYVPLGVSLSKRNLMRRIGVLNRAANRYPELDSVPKIQVIAPEVFYQFGLWLTKRNFQAIGEFVTEFSHRYYSIIVNKKLKNDDSEVLIIRCGFGNHIKASNKLRICDLSMAHPLVDHSLTQGDGFTLAPYKKLGRVSKLMVADLAKADRVIVNSEFIKRTCVLAGIGPSKITVAYLPPAHELLCKAQNLDIQKSKGDEVEVVLFVGTFSYRKGVDLVLKIAKECIFRRLKYKFVMIGSWSGVSAGFRKELNSLSNVEVIPWVTRDQLAEYYAKANFLLCPTRADGGARVITESMLFGVIVLTTTVSGSPIKSKIDGFEFELDRDESFVEEVLDVLQNKEITQEVGKRAIQTASVELSFNKYMSNVLSCCKL